MMIDPVMIDQYVWVFKFYYLLFSVGNEQWACPTLIPFVPVTDFYFCPYAFAGLQVNNAIITNLRKSISNPATNLRVIVSRNGCHLPNTVNIPFYRGRKRF